MELVLDEMHPRTHETTWLGSGQRARLAPLSRARPRWLVVVAPHHHHEVLGAGGPPYSVRRFWRRFEVCIEAGS
jgi:hypothetical protein